MFLICFFSRFCETGSSLTDEERNDLLNAADEDISKELQITDDDFPGNCSILHEELEKSRLVVDCHILSSSAFFIDQSIPMRETTFCVLLAGKT